jgi:hypothetical protein
MLRVNVFLSTLAILGVLVVPGIRSAADDSPKDAKIRIGTYDNRAITLAHVASRFHKDLMAEKMAALKKAKDAGDQAKVKELEAWGGQYQRQLHFQGFGRAPVDDLLEPVKEKIAQLARDKKLAAVTMSCDFTSEQVELVDVTEDLAKLYGPLEKGTLRAIREIRKVKPVKLAELKDNP